MEATATDQGIKLLSTQQAAEVLQVGITTLRRFITTGQLQATRFDGCLRIDSRDLAAFIEQAKQGQGVTT